MVENKIGFSELNNRVNVLMRQWIATNLMKVVDQEEEDNAEGGSEGSRGEGEEVERSMKLEHARKLYGIGRAMYEMGMYEEALRAYGRCRDIFEMLLGKELKIQLLRIMVLLW